MRDPHNGKCLIIDRRRHGVQRLSHLECGLSRVPEGIAGFVDGEDIKGISGGFFELPDLGRCDILRRPDPFGVLGTVGFFQPEFIADILFGSDRVRRFRPSDGKPVGRLFRDRQFPGFGSGRFSILDERGDHQPVIGVRALGDVFVLINGQDKERIGCLFFQSRDCTGLSSGRFEPVEAAAVGQFAFHENVKMDTVFRHAFYLAIPGDGNAVGSDFGHMRVGESKLRFHIVVLRLSS